MKTKVTSLQIIKMVKAKEGKTKYKREHRQWTFILSWGGLKWQKLEISSTDGLNTTTYDSEPPATAV